mgnify:CR=1 FL=1
MRREGAVFIVNLFVIFIDLPDAAKSIEFSTKLSMRNPSQTGAFIVNLIVIFVGFPGLDVLYREFTGTKSTRFATIFTTTSTRARRPHDGRMV